MKYYKKYYPAPNSNEVMVNYSQNQTTGVVISVYNDSISMLNLSMDYFKDASILATKEEFEEAFHKTINYFKNQI